jgi:hypothetical protein
VAHKGDKPCILRKCQIQGVFGRQRQTWTTFMKWAWELPALARTTALQLEALLCDGKAFGSL